MHLPFSFKSSLKRLMAVAATVSVAAIAGLSFTSAAAADVKQPLDRWEALRRDDLSVARVAYRLSLANAGRCGSEIQPQFGFVLHGIAQYGLADRADAAGHYGLGSLVGVMAVIPGSPAALAGMIAGDRLVSVNGQDLSPPTIAVVAPTSAGVVSARRLIAAQMAKGAVTIGVTGPRGSHDLLFTAAMGCPANVELDPGADVNAWADGHGVVVSAGLLRRCAGDDDLALVIAHELSHNLLHHAERLARADAAKSGLLQTGGAGSAAMRETEEEADRLGAQLAKTAGYDLGHAAAFLRGLLAPDSPDHPATTHPATARRLALLAADIAQAR